MHASCAMICAAPERTMGMAEPKTGRIWAKVRKACSCGAVRRVSTYGSLEVVPLVVGQVRPCASEQVVVLNAPGVRNSVLEQVRCHAARARFEGLVLHEVGHLEEELGLQTGAGAPVSICDFSPQQRGVFEAAFVPGSPSSCSRSGPLAGHEPRSCPAAGPREVLGNSSCHCRAALSVSKAGCGGEAAPAAERQPFVAHQ